MVGPGDCSRRKSWSGVGFQRITCDTRATVPAGTDPRLLELLQAQAERSCVNLDTLLRGVPVATSISVDTASAG